jgi:hypothetical protein
MLLYLTVLRLSAVVFVLSQHISASEFIEKPPSAIAEPGMKYGRSAELPLPKTVLFTAEPGQLIDDADEWARRGIDGFFLYRVAREWSNDIWATDGKSWTIGVSDETFQKTRSANEVCRKIGSDTFLKIAFDHHFDWFDDIAWQKINNNFKQFAIFARESGCTGIALDIEYIHEQYDYNWEGYSYDGYTRKDLVEIIRARMTKVAQILYDEFPQMVLLTFPEQSLRLGAHIHVAWIEEAARRNAPGGIHYCTEYTYRNPNIRYMFAYAWTCNLVFKRILSENAWEYWTENCSIAAGIWPFGFNYQDSYAPGMELEDFRQGIAASLMLSKKYNWIYSHNCREQLIGRDLDKYTGEADLKAYLKIIADREIVLEPKYINVAKDLRRMKLRDYSKELGLMPSVGFAGPEELLVILPTPVSAYNSEEANKSWQLALDHFHGEKINLQKTYATQTDWMIIGPFLNNKGFEGHHTKYPPEKEINFTAKYDGVNGLVKWMEHKQQETFATVDLKKLYTPNEFVCAYALCYVTSPTNQEVQIRLGSNDSAKLWLDGNLIYDYASEGTAILDRDIIQTTLPEGTTPILLKICNGELDWGFVFRITDTNGQVMNDLSYSTSLPLTKKQEK